MKTKQRTVWFVVASVAVLAGCLAWHYGLGCRMQVEPIEVENGPLADLGNWEGISEFKSLAELQSPTREPVQLPRHDCIGRFQPGRSDGVSERCEALKHHAALPDE